MKPITEDQVALLLDGLAAREKAAEQRRAQEVTDGTLAKRSATSRILGFARKANVVNLSEHRQTAQPRRTVSGMFYYNRTREASV